jgi:hypothetical protein
MTVGPITVAGLDAGALIATFVPVDFSAHVAIRAG